MRRKSKYIILNNLWNHKTTTRNDFILLLKKNKFTAHFTQMRLTTMKLVLNLIKQSFIIKIPICSSDVTNSPGSFNQKWFCIDWLIKLKLIYYLYYSYKQYVSYLSSYCIFDMKPYEARLKLCYYKLLME